MFVDYYELLEVTPHADHQAIKAAYRARMVRDHADQNPDCADAKERMILLTRAKQVLLDDHRRIRFNRERAAYQAARRLGMTPPRWSGGEAPPPSAGDPYQVDLREVSLGRVVVSVGIAAVVTGFGLAARAVSERAARKRRRG